MCVDAEERVVVEVSDLSDQCLPAVLSLIPCLRCSPQYSCYISFYIFSYVFAKEK